MAGLDAIYWGAYLKFETGNGITGTSYDSGGTINAGVTNFEANAGKVMSCIRLGGTPGKWGNGTASGGVPNTTAFSVMQAAVDPIIAHGAMPVSDWAPWDWALPSSNYAFRLQAINAGTWDPYLTTWFTAAASWGKPLLLRPMWEENWWNQFPWQYHDNVGSWNIGTANGWGGVSTWTNTKTDFINAWQHIVSIAQTTGAREGFGTGHVQFVWAPNRQTDTENAFSTLTPGDAYIDWYGWDSYPDGPGITITDASRGTNAMAYVRDIYAEMAALTPNKPFFIAETAWKAAQGSAVTPTSITSTTTTITVVVPATPAPGGNGWVATNGVKLTGVTPSAYNNEWTIASVTGTGPWTLTINSTANPGTATVLGSAQLIDDIARDTAISTDLETGFPQQMPRVRGFSLFYDGGFSYIPEFSPDDANARNSLSWASFKKHLNAHYLAGGQAPSIGTRKFIPFQDQPMTTAGSERYLAIVRSTPGLELLLPLTEAALSATVGDVSGKARNGTVNGGIGLGTAGSIPAEPTWTSTSYPGTSGNNVSVANNAALSPATTGLWSFELSFLMPSTPTAQSTLLSKAGFSGQLAGAVYEFQVWVSATQIGITLNQTNGATFASWSNPLPSTNVWHHLIGTVDTSQTLPIVTYLDGVLQVAGTGKTGTMGAGTAPLMVGQKFDNGSFLPYVAGGQIAAVSVYSAFLTAESVSEHYSAWLAAPVISAITPTTISSTAVDVAFTTNVGGSTQIEYGPTTAYGSLSSYDNQRLAGARTVHLTGLTPGALHFRPRSRNNAGTEAVAADQSSATLSAMYAMAVG